jgi:deazaflavin-dependent oxidoreductase (nitroreductase family)
MPRMRWGEHTAGLLLAAGEGRRLGRPKALVEVGGERLVDRGVRMLREAGCTPVIVVTGAAPVDVFGAVVVPNPQWRTGMGSSLRAGLAALPPGCPAAVIALVDQPRVTAEAVRRLIRAQHGGAEVAVATYGGRRRNPVLITGPHFAAVARAAVGDAGARAFLRDNPALVTAVPCDDVAAPDDIDTPEDLAAWVSGEPGGCEDHPYPQIGDRPMTQPRPKGYDSPLMPKFMKWMGAGHVVAYRLTRGKLVGKVPSGPPVCLFTTIGRTSGRPRTCPLLYLQDGDRIIVVASQGGLPTHPQWYLNLQANPNVHIQIGSAKRGMRARTADPAERLKLWPRLVEMHPSYDQYQQWTDREIPVVICEPAENPG